MKSKTLKTDPGSWLIALACLLCTTPLHAAQLVTVADPSRHPAAGGNGDSAVPLISRDGRFVLFTSSADNLTSVDTNAPVPPAALAKLNVFLRDRSNAVTTLVSVTLAGTHGGNADSLPDGLSTDGRYALFESSASDLVAGDTNGVSDVFVRDLLTGTTLPVSVSTNGDLGNGASRSAVMTPDGRYVAFVSAANNLVPGDTNGILDIFLRDLQLGTTTVVSAGAYPGQAGTAYGVSAAPEITPDGRYVAFYSTAANLVPGVTNIGDVFVRDVVAGTTVWASAYARTALQLALNATNGVSFGHSISADGQFVTYEASPFRASGAVPPPTARLGTGVILRYHVGSGLTDTVSTNAAVLISPTEDARNPVMTPDGRFVAFLANANGVPASNTCLLVWDAQTGTSVLASGDLAGTAPTNSICDWPAITPDGRFVAFTSTATNLVTNSLTGDFHLYVHDLQSGSTRLVDLGTNAAGSGVTPLAQPGLSDDGRFIAFEAPDGSLVPDDSNKSEDVFVSDAAGAAIELISRHDPLLPSISPDGPSTLSFSSVSAEGSFVAFVSEADNLTSIDTNGYRDVFVRDRLGDATLLVSADMSGTTTGNGMSTEPAISADGRYVVFTSTATNLITGDTNGVSDVFVRDLVEGTTQLVSVNPQGFSGHGASYLPTISADGRAVLFHSLASDLAPVDFGLGLGETLFWRDLWSGTTYGITRCGPSSAYYSPATMTPSGRFVVFGGDSLGTNWYVWDSQALTIVYTNTSLAGSSVQRVWTSTDGSRIAYVSSSNLYLVDRGSNTAVVLGGALLPGKPCFSADLRFLAYMTRSAGVPADTNKLSDVYLYDCQTGSNVLVSQAFDAPASANGASDSPAISPDGRFVAYRSAASNVVPNAANGVPNIFLWDRITGVTLLMSVSRSMNSSADNRSLTPVFSSDSRTLMFESWASDLVAGDLNRSGALFAVNIYASGPIPLFKAAIVPAVGPSQGLWISWPLIPGKTYQVQFKNGPRDSVWQSLGGSVTMVGNQGYLYDLAPGSSQRLYRVVAQ